MSRKIKCFLLSGLFGLLALSGNGSFAACPELADYPDFDCSFPYFSQGVDVSIKHEKGEVPEGWVGNSVKKLKATYRESSASSLLFAPDDVYEISDTSLKIRIRKKSSGGYGWGIGYSGKVKIKGRITELGIDKKQVLMKARLRGDWSDGSGNLLGGIDNNTQLISFALKDLVCNEKIDAYKPCTSNDEGGIILALNDDIYSNQNVTTTGTAVTSVSHYAYVGPPLPGLAVASVPLPAAAWLFGSGLLGLIGIARRK